MIYNRTQQHIPFLVSSNIFVNYIRLQLTKKHIVPVKPYGDNTFKLSCFLESECDRNNTSPCTQLNNQTIELCPAYRIDGTGTSQDYTLKLCYEQLSPFQFQQCYQIDVVSGIRTCTFNLGDEVCRQCGFNVTDNSCIQFDCTNTASNTIGDTCNDDAVSDLLYLDLFNCPGACDICGDNGKLSNPDLDISPIIGYYVDCQFCSTSGITCADAQTIALAGGLDGSTCEFAPGVDISTQCCSSEVVPAETVPPEPETTPPDPGTPPETTPPEPETTPPDTPPPPPETSPPETSPPDTSPNLDDVFCEDLNWDCFSCIEKDGCYWCPGDALCTSGPIFLDTATAVIRNNSCTVPEDFVTDTCTADGNFFSDPLYSSQKWIFDMINIEEVWAKGIFGNGIRVRVNDEGFESR